MKEEFSTKVRNHKGGLIQVVGQFYLYSPRAWAISTDWVAIVLDAHAVGESKDVPVMDGHGENALHSIAIHLILDGKKRWLWLSELDVKFL